MARLAQRGLLMFFGLMLCNFAVLAQGGPPGDNIIDGTLYPHGYTPVEIKDGVYPCVYAPNTEKLGPKEMRVTALGTGMPNVITGRTGRKWTRYSPATSTPTMWVPLRNSTSAAG